MERIVFLDRSTLTVELRAPRFAHEWIDHEVSDEAQVVERLANATICVTNKVPVRADALAQLQGLRLIAVAATGVDILDLAACDAQKIAVRNVGGYAATSVAEHALALMLSLSRSLPAYERTVQDGGWQRARIFAHHVHPIRDLRGATLGIVGYGAIGQRTAQLGEALGMRPLIAERRGRTPREGRVPFEAVLAQSDVLSLHAPLTPQTDRLIDGEALARMKPNALLINTGRGALVDEAALAQALQAGRLGGAGIDVLGVEPPAQGGPLLALSLPNLIITPHVGWASQGSQTLLAERLIQTIEDFVLGATSS